MKALLLFHFKAGIRLAMKSFTPVFSAALAILMLNIDAAGAERGLARDVFSAQDRHNPTLAAIAGLAFLFAFSAARRLAHGANGWVRHMPFTDRSNRRALAAALVAVQLPLVIALGLLGFVAHCGKSTLLKLAAGVERPDSGRVEIMGCDLWTDEVAARRNLAYVPEHPDLTPYATIKDVIRLVCRLRSEPYERGREVLESVGLDQVAKRSIRELSMGQRRRAVLAAAWIGSPRVVLLDEPLEAMDRGMRQEILAWICRLTSTSAVVVIATHEIEPFVSEAARAISFAAGSCTLHDPLPEPAGKLAFLESLSRLGSRDQGLGIR